MKTSARKQKNKKNRNKQKPLLSGLSYTSFLVTSEIGKDISVLYTCSKPEVVPI